MKLKVRKFFLVLVFQWAGLITCFGQEPSDFYFKEAQPRKEDELTRFPSSIRGLYKNDKDTTRRLRITGDSISVEVPFVQYATLEEIAKKNYEVRDTVLLTPSGKQLPCLQKSDTVFFVDFAASVLFACNETQIIKRVDDVYVLSKRKQDDKWECLLLYRENSKLCIAYFDFDKKTKELLENKKIEKIKDDNGHYFLANLKKKDFVKLVDNNYFPIKQYYTKRFDWQ
ncbi:MAG TPA: hypothetical protein VD905_03710 [Flavobacteriales bacterium]|nr:hypothetical protein [Flavobacteriales bacterium]